MRGYKMACCDCGLVHALEFRVMRVTQRLGKWTMSVPVSEHIVLFRAKRMKRETGQVRRHMKQKAVR
jgi:hypothetical protein